MIENGVEFLKYESKFSDNTVEDGKEKDRRAEFVDGGEFDEKVDEDAEMESGGKIFSGGSE